MSFELVLPEDVEAVHTANVDNMDLGQRQRFFESAGGLKVSCVGSKFVVMIPDLGWLKVEENVHTIPIVLLEALLFPLFQIAPFASEIALGLTGLSSHAIELAESLLVELAFDFSPSTQSAVSRRLTLISSQSDTWTADQQAQRILQPNHLLVLEMPVAPGVSAAAQKVFWNEPAHYGAYVKLKNLASDNGGLAAAGLYVRFFPNRHTNDERSGFRFRSMARRFLTLVKKKYLDGADVDGLDVGDYIAMWLREIALPEEFGLPFGSHTSVQSFIKAAELWESDRTPEAIRELFSIVLCSFQSLSSVVHSEISSVAYDAAVSIAQGCLSGFKSEGLRMADLALLDNFAREALAALVDDPAFFVGSTLRMRVERVLAYATSRDAAADGHRAVAAAVSAPAFGGGSSSKSMVAKVGLAFQAQYIGLLVLFLASADVIGPLVYERNFDGSFVMKGGEKSVDILLSGLIAIFDMPSMTYETMLRIAFCRNNSFISQFLLSDVNYNHALFTRLAGARLYLNSYLERWLARDTAGDLHDKCINIKFSAGTIEDVKTMNLPMINPVAIKFIIDLLKTPSLAKPADEDKMWTIAGGLAENLAFLDHVISALGNFDETTGFLAQLSLLEKFHRGWPTGVRHIADVKVTEIVVLMINEAHPRIRAWFMGAPGMPFPQIFTQNDTWRETLRVWATQRDSDLTTAGSLDMLIQSGMFSAMQSVAGASAAQGTSGAGPFALQAQLPVARTPAHSGQSSKKKHKKQLTNTSVAPAAPAVVPAAAFSGAKSPGTATAPTAAARSLGSSAPLVLGALKHNVKVTPSTVTIKFDARPAFRGKPASDEETCEFKKADIANAAGSTVSACCWPVCFLFALAGKPTFAAAHCPHPNSALHQTMGSGLHAMPIGLSKTVASSFR
jgi:hypothetical protein